MYKLDIRTKNSCRVVGSVFIFLSVVLGGPAAHAISVRELGTPSGYVNDYTGLLDSSYKSKLISLATDLERANGAELAIVMVNSTDGVSIENYAQELFEKWGIGKRYADNGLLILIAVNDRKWRVHTGYGIEGAIPDSLAKRIMENEAVPEFRERRFGPGILKASEAFKKVLEGEKYEEMPLGLRITVFLVTFGPMILIGLVLWMGLRIKCSKCGGRVRLLKSTNVLKATYNHSGIQKREYECMVCGFKFNKMDIIPMMQSKSSKSSGGFFGGWTSIDYGGDSFSGFGGGSSGGGGASGGW